MLKAGYLEDWEYHDTLSGVPQGGTVSPILSNIYLDKLDKFVEQELIPQYTRGATPDTPILTTGRLSPAAGGARRRGDRAAARALRKAAARAPLQPTRWTPATAA